MRTELGNSSTESADASVAMPLGVEGDLPVDHVNYPNDRPLPGCTAGILEAAQAVSVVCCTLLAAQCSPKPPVGCNDKAQKRQPQESAMPLDT